MKKKNIREIERIKEEVETFADEVVQMSHEENDRAVLACLSDLYDLLWATIRTLGEMLERG